MDTARYPNVAQAAKLLRVSVPVIYRLVKSGGIRSFRINSRQISVDVDSFISEALKPIPRNEPARNESEGELVSVAFAANRLRLHKQTIYNLAKTGKVKSVPVGPGKIKICRTSLFYPDETINYDGLDISRLEF